MFCGGLFITLAVGRAERRARTGSGHNSLLVFVGAAGELKLLSAGLVL